MDMHQAGREPDWVHTPVASRSYWQRLAAASNGYLTPGNMMSVVGLLCVLFGLVAFVRHDYVSGFWLVGIGRMADLLDGMIAHRTKTKSQIGEALDAGIDKIELLAVVIALAILHAAPFGLLAAIIAVNAAIAVVSALSKAKNIALHPVRTGKLATFALWVSLGLYIGYAGRNNEAAISIANVILLVAIIMSAIALAKYIHHFIRSMSPDIAGD